MTTTEPPRLGGDPSGPAPSIAEAPGRAEGLELLGPVKGSGYKDGANLVRRADGQIVQLGPLMYSVLDCIDGARTVDELAGDLSDRLGRTVGPEHVVRLAEKLADLGLLAGSEHQAPPRRNPLLALRWKVLVTNPRWTVRLTNPFRFLFRPWVMWPVLAAFAGVVWFVIIRKGVASATADAFHRPGLLLLVFALGVVSAGFHEWGHAAACRYGGATPGGMGMGVYLVWPAFYTDVTDTYRLPRRARLRVDLAGLYFNAIVAVLTMAVWLFWRVDALLLLVALQVLQMVKQLSPVIRADGYHILSDATGVPDLYSHMGPTMKRLLPGHRRQPSALSGRARLLVTAWVLVIVPVLFGLMFSAVLLLPHLATSAWDSGRLIARAIPHQIGNGQVINLFDSVLELLALVLPVLGSLLVTQKFVRMLVGRARSWSKDSPVRKIAAASAAAGAVALLMWAWWPSGQYQPVRANQNGTISGLVHLVAAPTSAARPAVVAGPTLTPGAHLAVAMIPAAGIGPHTPAVFIIPGTNGRPATELLLGGGRAGPTNTGATAVPFKLPAPPGPGGNQALAVNTTDHGV
ncbi:MAG TPA: hypothetical protein VG435_05990, partial [Acidimicrobiales bacterium]|nr:hypothetical protein [Acidimicrobiales bacterium]